MTIPIPSSPPRPTPQSQPLSFFAGTTVENTPIQQCTAGTVASYPPFFSGTTVENTPVQQSTTHNAILNVPVSSRVLAENEGNASDIIQISDSIERDEIGRSIVELPILITSSANREHGVDEESREISDSETFEDPDLDSSPIDATRDVKHNGDDMEFPDKENIEVNNLSAGDEVLERKGVAIERGKVNDSHKLEEYQHQILDGMKGNKGEKENPSSMTAVDNPYAEDNTSLLIKQRTMCEQPRPLLEGRATSTEPTHLNNLLPSPPEPNDSSNTTLASDLKTKDEEFAANNTPLPEVAKAKPLSELSQANENDIAINAVAQENNDVSNLKAPSSLPKSFQTLVTGSNGSPLVETPDAVSSPQQQIAIKEPPMSEIPCSPTKIIAPYAFPAKQTPVSDLKTPAAAEGTVTPNRDRVLMTELKAMKMASIQARNASLEEEISRTRAKTHDITKTLTAPASETVKSHIKLLHTYNDIRDVGQGLIGMIADNRGVRIGELYEEFGVGLKD